MKPKISIIIPVYNGSNYMREAIDSALSQTYDNIEIIVVNDGSTDNSEEIALSYGDKIKYFSKENGGVSTALNLGISNMTGDYFQFLPHDDLLHPKKIEKQINLIEQSGQSEAIVWSDWDMYDQNTKSYKTVVYPYEHDFKNKVTKGVYPMLYSLITIVTVLFPKKYLDEAGEFNPALSTAQDYDMMFRTFQGRDTIYLDEVLVHYRWHEEQGTQADSEFIANCKNMAIKMEDNISKEEIHRVFGNEYYFLYCMLDHYLDFKWRDCFDRSVNKFLDMPQSVDTRKNTKEFLADNNLSDKEIVIYCAGSNGTKLKKYFDQRLIKVKCFSDGNSNKWGQEFCGLKCVPPSELDKNKTALIVSKDNPDSLVNILKKDGFKNVTSFKEIGPKLYSIIPDKSGVLKSWGMQ